MIGQVPAMWTVLASDAVAHLCNFLLPCSLPTAATDYLKSRRSQRRLYSDSPDHVLVLHAQHPTCLRYAPSISFRRNRRCNRDDRVFPLHLGPSEFIEHVWRYGDHGVDVHLNFDDHDKLLRFDV